MLGRVRAAAAAGFVMAFYNPRSRARPWQLGQVLSELRAILPADVPVVFAAAVTRPEERIAVTTLAEADPAWADMHSLVLVGSRQTRLVPRDGMAPWIYTQRGVAEAP